jgi:hypothetical protein
MQRRLHVVATNAALVSGMVCNGANALSVIINQPHGRLLFLQILVDITSDSQTFSTVSKF